MKRDKALMIAEKMISFIAPACERIEVKGSICRGSAEVKDIEILAIPDLTPPPAPRLEFGKPIPKIRETKLDVVLDVMAAEKLIQRHKDGKKFKKIYWMNDGGIMIDLFLVTPPATWGVLSVIRTGPADFSHWCVTRRKIGGAMPDGFRVQDGAVWEGAREDETHNKIGFKTEQEFLDFLGLGWLEPGERVARWSGGSKIKA